MALLIAADTDTVSPLRLNVIGPAPLAVEDLAVFLNSDGGHTDADTIDAAVLHALKILEFGTTGSAA